MIPIENLRMLAATAFDAKNFDQAYRYFSEILEQDPSDANAWVRKGLASGMLSSMTGLRVDECLHLVEVGTCKASDKALAVLAADKLIDIYEHTIRVLNGALVAQVSDHQKATMPEGGSTLLYLAGQSMMRISSAKLQAEAKVRALDLVALSVKLDPSEANYSALINAGRGLLLHSSRNGDYLKSVGTNPTLHEKVTTWLGRMSAEASERHPAIKQQLAASPSNEKSGCFIATAALGTDSHPHLDLLREYRDTVLLASAAGAAFVQGYYRLSPPVADVLRRSPALRRIVRDVIVGPAARFAERRLRMSDRAPALTASLMNGRRGREDV